MHAVWSVSVALNVLTKLWDLSLFIPKKYIVTLKSVYKFYYVFEIFGCC